jgi:hypothetical protein
MNQQRLIDSQADEENDEPTFKVRGKSITMNHGYYVLAIY